jgi:hypothetical protein
MIGGAPFPRSYLVRAKPKLPGMYEFEQLVYSFSIYLFHILLTEGPFLVSNRSLSIQQRPFAGGKKPRHANLNDVSSLFNRPLFLYTYLRGMIGTNAKW